METMKYVRNVENIKRKIPLKQRNKKKLKTQLKIATPYELQCTVVILC